MGKGYVLAPGYLAAQFWNGDRSDLVEVRGAGAEVPSDIPAAERDRLVKLGAITEAGSVDAQPAPVTGAVEEPAGNATRDEWAAYADSLGLVVDPQSGREDIKKLVSDSRS